MEENGRAVFTDDSPEFFKIYVAELCAEQLWIPPDFLAKFDGDVPRKLILEGPGGRSWETLVQKVDQDFCLSEGWPNFVQDNSLEFGDFLTFCYDGSSKFYVKIFGTHCCRKDLAITRDNAGKKKCSSNPLSNDGVTWGAMRLRPGNNAGRKSSSRSDLLNQKALIPREEPNQGRSALLAERALRPRNKVGKLSSSRIDSTRRMLHPKDNGISSSSAWLARLRPRNNAGKSTSIEITPRSLRPRIDAGNASNTRLTRRTLHPGDSAGKSTSTWITEKRLRPRDKLLQPKKFMSHNSIR